MLKMGARIEDRRLLEAEAQVKCLAFDAVTARPGISRAVAERGLFPLVGQSAARCGTPLRTK